MAKRIVIIATWVSLSGTAAAACSSTETSRELTYANAIEPLVAEKCQTCHREGGSAPFPLLTYDDLRSVGPLAKDKVARREMPPWGAFDDEYCTVAHKYKNDLSLTQQEIDTFVQWVDRGMPPGKVTPRRMPKPLPVRPKGLVEPTSRFPVATTHMVEGRGPDDIRCFPFDPHFDRDVWITESMVVPENPKVVHHALVYIVPDQEAGTKAGEAGSYPCFGGPDVKSASLLLAWSPGEASTTYGQSAGVHVPKGSQLLMQVHYHPLEASTTGRLNLEIHAIPANPGRVAQFVLMGNAEDGSRRANPRLLPGPADPPEGPAFVIPSNAKDHVEVMDFTLPDILKPTRLVAVGAHMHWAGAQMRIEVHRKAPTDEDPADECLFSMPKYDFTWQRTFAYDTPVEKAPVLQAGDRLRVTCTYDNTRENRHIVKLMNEERMTEPPEIRLGGRSIDEMCQAMLIVIN